LFEAVFYKGDFMQTFRCLSAACLVLDLAIQSSATRYYVAEDGDDTNAGALDDPCKTVAFALCSGEYGCPCSQEMAGKKWINQSKHIGRSLVLKNAGNPFAPTTASGAFQWFRLDGKEAWCDGELNLPLVSGLYVKIRK
jgi:hypothetical protein